MDANNAVVRQFIDCETASKLRGARYITMEDFQWRGHAFANMHHVYDVPWLVKVVLHPVQGPQ